MGRRSMEEKEGRKCMEEKEALPVARRRVANAIGAVARRMWRRKDLEAADHIVTDLLAEALARLGGQVRPAERSTVKEALTRAPAHMAAELEKLAALAKRSSTGGGLAPVTPVVRATARSRSGTPPPSRREETKTETQCQVKYEALLGSWEEREVPLTSWIAAAAEGFEVDPILEARRAVDGLRIPENCKSLFVHYLVCLDDPFEERARALPHGVFKILAARGGIDEGMIVIDTSGSSRYWLTAASDLSATITYNLGDDFGMEEACSPWEFDLDDLGRQGKLFVEGDRRLAWQLFGALFMDGG